MINIGKEKEQWVEYWVEDDGCAYCHTIKCSKVDCDECILNPYDGFDLSIKIDELKRMNRVEEV